MYKVIPFLASLFFLLSCKEDDASKVSFKEDVVQLSTHQLATYSTESGNSKYLVVFESGLGNDHTVWQTKNVAEDISTKMDVVVMTEQAMVNLPLMPRHEISTDFGLSWKP